MKHKFLCLGDSNTFGYNPCSPLSDRYPRSVRWTGILNSSDRWEIVNGGENGREIPYRDWELDRAKKAIHYAQPEAVLIMLGTNDLLGSLAADTVTCRMETMLNCLLEEWTDRSRLLLASPVRMVRGLWVLDPELPDRVRHLAHRYDAMAEQLGISFVDAGSWEVTLAFDGVHLTPEGHKVVAEGMNQALQKLFP